MRRGSGSSPGLLSIVGWCQDHLWFSSASRSVCGLIPLRSVQRVQARKQESSLGCDADANPLCPGERAVSPNPSLLSAGSIYGAESLSGEEPSGTALALHSSTFPRGHHAFGFPSAKRTGGAAFRALLEGDVLAWSYHPPQGTPRDGNWGLSPPGSYFTLSLR